MVKTEQSHLTIVNFNETSKVLNHDVPEGCVVQETSQQYTVTIWDEVISEFYLKVFSAHFKAFQTSVKPFSKLDFSITYVQGDAYSLRVIVFF